MEPTPAGYIGTIAMETHRFWTCGDEFAARRYSIKINDADTWPSSFDEFLYANGMRPERSMFLTTKDTQ